MSEPTPAVQRRRLAIELRALMAARGISSADLEAASEGVLQNYNLSRWLSGRNNIAPADLSMILGILGADREQRALLMELNKQARKRRRAAWWQSYLADGAIRPDFAAYIAFEGEAAFVDEYSPELVPGLLQTPDYYRALLSTALPDAGNTQRKIEARAVRQQRLSGDAPVERYWAILNEAVVRRPVGGLSVMREQLSHLVHTASLPNVNIQVLPFSAGAHPAMDGGFTVLKFPEVQKVPDVVYMENQTGSLYLEAESESQRYARLFHQLSATAMSPAESLTEIECAARDLGNDL